MMLILPIYEHGMCFHLLCLLQFISSVTHNFWSTGLLHPWLGLFLGILFFFCNNCKWIFKKFPFLLVHYWHIKMQLISEYEFCILLHISFVSSSSFLVESLGFSIYSIMSSASKDSFTSSFLI